MDAATSNIPQQLVGFWKIRNGDYRLINEYRGTGEMVQYVNGTDTGPSRFSVDKSCLIAYVTQKNGDVLEFKNKYSLTQNTLIFFDDDKSTRTFDRVKDEKGKSLKAWWKIW